MLIIEFIFWFSIFLFFYVFIGYPVFISCLGKFFPRSRVRDESFQPMVTLIISAYNEEEVIREKILNSLELSYPKEKLEIIVVSDASTDRTDDIVREFEAQGVFLKRMSQRGGKTLGLNSAVPEAGGEIIVFSDANAMYEDNAVGKLVRNFKDHRVGCVTGDSLYVNLEGSRVGGNEKSYWDYDRFLKVMETKVGSMVGSDGALFAIRKSLYAPLDFDDINDFVLPLKIVSNGYDCIFEQEAICKESATTYLEEEFRRKVRVVNRSWNGFWKVKKLLNPFRYGWFSVQLFSHKLLRWLVPIPLVLIFFSSIWLVNHHWFYFAAVIVQVVGYALGGYGILQEIRRMPNNWLSFPAYFLTVMVASVIGIVKSIQGERITVWNPERKVNSQAPRKVGSFLLKLIFVVVGIGYVFTLFLWPALMFWATLGILLYTYVGYPLSLMCLMRFKSSPWEQSLDSCPSLTLVIVAHNEGEVLEAKILNSLALEYAPGKLTVLVASDGSTDETNVILEKYREEGIRSYLGDVKVGKTALLNRVVPALDTEIILVSDANVLYSKDVLQKIVRNFYDTQVGVVSGKVKLLNPNKGFGASEALYYRYEWFLKYLESRLHSQIGVDGAMYAFRKRLFPCIPDNVVVDDLVLPMTISIAGKRVVSEYEAIGYEHSPDSLAAEFSRHVRITAGAIQSIFAGLGLPGVDRPLLFFKFFSHKILRWLTGIFMVGVFISNSLILGSVFYQVTFGGQLIFYLVALGGRLHYAPTIFVGPLYMCVINAACTMGLIRGLFNLQKSQWVKTGRSSVENYDMTHP